MKEKIISRIALVLISLTVLSCIVQGGFGNIASAEGSIDTVIITVGAVCSITANVTSVHSATLAPGEYSGSTTLYANGIGSTELIAFCNDASGFSIYTIGYTGDADGTTTLVGEDTGQVIATGTATSGDTSNWAMKLTKVTDDTVSYNPTNLTIANGFDDFHIVPSTYTQVASYSSNTDATLGSQILTTYAAYVKPTQAADTYVGKVKYTLVHPSANDPNSYYVDFYANGGSGTMNSQKIALNTASALSANTFIAPTGKTFNVWNTASDGSGTSYANMAEVTALAGAGSTISLYAQWRDPITIATATYMQDVDTKSNGGCPSTIPAGEVYVLKDSRDEKSYKVARLADGNCWMLDNLALDITAVSLDTLKGRTNASDTALTYLKNGGGSGKYPLIGVATITANNNINPGNTYTQAVVVAGKNGVDYSAQTVTSYGQGNGAVGAYYNYCAASAGNYCYDSDAGVDDPDGTTTLRDTIYDICPAGWRLPTGGPNGEYQAIFIAYGSNQTAANSGSLQYNLSTPLAGYFGSGAVVDGETYGNFWTSTYLNGKGMSRLRTSESTVTMATAYRSNGLSVRCLLYSQ